MEQVAQRICGYLIPEIVQGLSGCGFDQPGLEEGL